MYGYRLNSFTRERIRQLCRAGWTVAEICREVGHRRPVVNKVLLDARLIAPIQPTNPILDYRPLPDDGDALTENQLRERETAARRAFQVRVEYEMSISSARRCLSMSADELMRRDGMTEEQARFVRDISSEFLKRLGMTETTRSGSEKDVEGEPQ